MPKPSGDVRITTYKLNLAVKRPKYELSVKDTLAHLERVKIFTSLMQIVGFISVYKSKKMSHCLLLLHFIGDICILGYHKFIPLKWLQYLRVF